VIRPTTQRATTSAITQLAALLLGTSFPERHDTTAETPITTTDKLLLRRRAAPDQRGFPETANDDAVAA
jgi:hypothetical protein